MKNNLIALLLIFLISGIAVNVQAQSLSSQFYDIGSPSVTDYYVDPAVGDDNNSGTSRSAPRKTVSSIWNDIPDNSSLNQGVRINLLPGNYGSSHLPNYWEKKRGTLVAPIIIRAADGFGTVSFTRDINMAEVSYFYLLGVDIANRLENGFGDAFHCEKCDHILLRGNSFNGAPNGRNAGGDVAHETIKFNQSQYVYIENNNIQGADDNGIDWVAVQYGHIRGNRIHDTQSWGTYVKGGSSYILIESNLVYDCFEGGITAGQGTGLEFMEAPFLRFEANYVKIVNNIIHDVSGAALGVNGGYGILVAHNTAYRVGSRSHLIEVVFGERSCDGDITACANRRSAGGWGPAASGSENAQPIGNQDIIVANNVIYNPSDFSPGSQHFAIYGPRVPTAGGIPSPQTTDNGLIIKGNVIWSGAQSQPLGIEDSDQGCQIGNTTCNLNQLVLENSINTLEPDFIAPADNDFRPAAGGRLAAANALAMPNIPAIDSDLNPIAEGERSNLMTREFSGAISSNRPAGAIVSSDSSIEFPASAGEGGVTPGSGNGSNSGPQIKVNKSSAARSNNKVRVSAELKVSDSDGVNSVTAVVMVSGKELGQFTFKLKKSTYKGGKQIKTAAKKVTLKISASDQLGKTSVKTKTIKVN